MSLGLRLLFLNGLVLALVLGGFATVAYVTQEQALRSSLDVSLRDQAALVRTNGPVGLGRGRLRPGVLPGPPGGRLGSDPAASDVPATGQSGSDPAVGRPPPFVAPDVFVQVSTRGGEVVARSRNLDDQALPIPPDLLPRVLAGDEVYVDVVVDGEELRMFMALLRFGPPLERIPTGIVQVARPLAPLQAHLRTLRTTFLTLGVVGVGVSLLLGWLLARAALRPIDRLAAVAHAIGVARDFGRRIPVAAASRRDEIGRLSTELNDMLAQLQDAYAQLEAALAAQRRFVADASHELRTPLTSLRGNVALLQRAAALGTSHLDPDEEEQLLADMAAETERLTRLVADLLLLAQADAGQHLTLAPIELGPLVHDAFRAARFLRPGVELHLGPVPGDVWVQGDPDRLKQLFLILLDNALKYTPLGGRVTIGATSTPGSSSHGAIVVAVTDTGPGIPPHERAHLFDRFYRLDQARGSDGAGLGLAIARWIADEHHGTIEVDSTPGAGSTFCITLPTVPRPPDTNGHAPQGDRHVAATRS